MSSRPGSSDRDAHVAATLRDEQRSVLEVYSRTHAGLVPDAIQAILASHDGLLGKIEGREGMVTVWDEERRYVGCMGVELWRHLLTVEAT